jgi:hypothetical protein
MDVEELERRLRSARERLDRALRAMTGESASGGLDEYSLAREACLSAERALALATGEEAAIESDWPLPWDVGAPSPHVLSSGHRTLLLYYIADPDPAWDGTYVTVADPRSDSRSRIALVEFERCYAHRFGGPNDEVFGGHPLTGRGFGGYGAYLVQNSRWIALQRTINGVHDNYDPYRWNQYEHYLLAFHDDMFECIAEGYRTVELNVAFGEALETARQRLLE